jgi:hypothetical protein
MRLGVIALAAGLIATATAFAVAVAFLLFNRWFGAGDLGAFGFWSLFFAGASGFASFVFASSSKHWGCIFRYTGGLFLGLLLGFGFTYGVALMLGPWFGAFSFPVLYCWMIGGIAGMFFAVASTERKAEPNAPDNAGIALAVPLRGSRHLARRV